MSHYPSVYGLLRKDRDDFAKAALFEEWLAEQAETTRHRCAYYLNVLTESGGLSETGARAALASLICFLSVHVDEQDKMRVHGEAVRAAFEWAAVKADVEVDA